MFWRLRFFGCLHSGCAPRNVWSWPWSPEVPCGCSEHFRGCCVISFCPYWYRCIWNLKRPECNKQKKNLVISESSNKGGSFWIDTWHSNRIAVRNKEGRILRGRAADFFGIWGLSGIIFHKENRVSRPPNHENFAPAARLSTRLSRYRTNSKLRAS